MKVDRNTIDREILDLVLALNNGGVATISSCSGHGKEHGHIWLKDGRVLIIYHPNYTKDDQAVKAGVVKMVRK